MKGLFKLNNTFKTQTPKIADWILKYNSKSHIVLEVFLNFDISAYMTNHSYTTINFKLVASDNTVVNVFNSSISDFHQNIRTIPVGSTGYTQLLFPVNYIVNNNMLYTNNSGDISLIENNNYTLRLTMDSEIVNSTDTRTILKSNDALLPNNPVNFIFGSNGYVLKMDNHWFKISDIFGINSVINGVPTLGNSFTTLNSINNTFVVSNRVTNTDFNNTSLANIACNNSSSGSLVIKNAINNTPTLISFSITNDIFSKMVLNNVNIGLNHEFNYQTLSSTIITVVPFTLYNPLFKLLSNLTITTVQLNYVSGIISNNTVSNTSCINGLFTFFVNYSTRSAGTYPLDNIVITFSTGLILKISYIGKSMVFV